MLPFDSRPWAKPLARTVIVVSILAAALLAYYLYITEELHIPEVTGIVLLLLTIVPPNIAIIRRRSAPAPRPAAGTGTQAHATAAEAPSLSR